MECWSCEWGADPSDAASYSTDADALLALTAGTWVGRYEGRFAEQPIDVTLTIQPAAEEDVAYRRAVVVGGTGDCQLPADSGCEGLSLAAEIQVATFPAAYGFDAQRVDLWGTEARTVSISESEAAAGEISPSNITIHQSQENLETHAAITLILGVDGRLWMRLTPDASEDYSPVVLIGGKVADEGWKRASSLPLRG